MNVFGLRIARYKISIKISIEYNTIKDTDKKKRL